MKKNDLTARYGLIQGAYWVSFAANQGFVSLYLLDHGFTSTLVGILIAAAGILSALLQPVVAAYADRPDSLNLKTINLLVTSVTLLCGVGLLFFPASGVLTLGLYALAIAALQLSYPMVNSLAVTSANCGSSLNFGLAKCAGSAAFAIGSILMGRLAQSRGSDIVPIGIILCNLALLGSLLLYPAQKVAPTEHSGQAASLFGFFRKYRRYSAVLCGCGLLFISHVLLNNFLLQITQTKGGDSSAMGIAMAVAALVEIPTMACFRLLMKRAGSHVWLRICCVFFALKNLATLLCTTVPGLYAAQALQMFAWAPLSVCTVYYINAIMSPEDSIKGQAYYTMTYTAATVLSSIVGGRMIDALGVPAMVLFGLVCAIAGAVIVLVFTEKTNDRGIAA